MHSARVLEVPGIFKHALAECTFCLIGLGRQRGHSLFDIVYATNFYFYRDILLRWLILP